MPYTVAPKKVLTMERVTSPISKFEEVGRLYKGNPKPERGPGRDYASHYMRFEPADRFKVEPASDPQYANMAIELKARWEELIGRGSIKVIFPFATVEEVLSIANRVTKMVGASAKTMVECDPRSGRNTKWVENAIANGKPVPKVVTGDRPCQAGEDGVCPLGCIPRAMLKISIPELWPGGIVLFPLGSIIDIGNILGALQPYANIDLRGVPSWSLFRKEDQISWEDPVKGTQTKANWSVNLTIDPQVTAMLAAKQQRQFLRSVNEDIPDAIEVTPQRAIAPSRQPSFRNSADHKALQVAIDIAVENQDYQELDLAIESAMDLIDQGFYPEDDRRIIKQACEVGQDRISQRRSIAPKKEINPGGFAGAIVESDVVDVELAKAFWVELQEAGWTSEGLLNSLAELGYTSLKVVPADRWEAVKKELIAIGHDA